MLSVQEQQSAGDEGAGTPPPPSRRRRWLAALVLLAASVVLFFVGFAPTFNHFRAYNDEGLFLVQFRDAVARTGPYSHLYSAYGPAYNLFVAAITTVTRVPIDHDGNRLITLVLWVAAAAVAGIFVWRETRSLPLMAMAVFVGFLWIEILTDEPGQPATFGFLLTFAILLAAQRRDPWRGRSAALIGALCMALLLVKINLGIYAIAAVVFSIVATARCPRWLRVLVFVASAALPLAILRQGLAQHGVEVLLFLFIVELGVATLILRTYPGPRHLAVRWRRLAGGAVVVLVLVLLGAVYQGDGVAAVLRAVLFHSLNYLSNGGTFTVRMAAPWVASLFACSATAVVLFRPWPWLRIALRAVVVLTVFLPVLYPNSSNGFLSPLMAWAVVPVLLIGQGRPRAAPSTPRVCLAAMIVFNELQTYPIPGSHLAFSSFLAVPAACIVTADLMADILVLGSGRTGEFARMMTLGVVICVTAVAVIESASTQWSLYSRNVPLRLAGSRLIRLPSAQAAALEATVRDVRSRSCTTLVTYPGMLSFYAWTGLPAPPGIVVADSVNWQRPQNRASTEKYLLRAHNTCLVSNHVVEVFWENLDGIPSSAGLTHVLTTRFARNQRTHGTYVVSQSVP